MVDINPADTTLVWPGKHTCEESLQRILKDPPRIIPCSSSLDCASSGVKSYTQPPKSSGWHNQLVLGDNMSVMSAWSTNLTNSVDLIYVDPPFASGMDYTIKQQRNPDGSIRKINFWNTKNKTLRTAPTTSETAYRDRWQDGYPGYLNMMYPRLRLIHRLLSPTGHLFLHCDWHINAYLRILLDEIFSPACYKGEIIWQRTKLAGRVAKPRKFDIQSDSILFYSKTPEAKIKPVKAQRTYTLEEAKKIFKYDKTRQAFYKDAPCGNYAEDTIKHLASRGRIRWTSRGRPRVKRYLSIEVTPQGDRVVEEVYVGNIWTDIPGMMQVGKSQSTGYPTQKPEGLLERIILAGSSQNDLVADVFCGSGTSLCVAQKLGRRFVGCDASESAVDTSRKRLHRTSNPAGYALRIATVEQVHSSAQNHPAEAIEPQKNGDDTNHDFPM